MNFCAVSHSQTSCGAVVGFPADHALMLSNFGHQRLVFGCSTYARGPSAVAVSDRRKGLGTGRITFVSDCGIRILGERSGSTPLKRDPDDLACRPRKLDFSACSLARRIPLSSPIRRPVLPLCRSGVVLSVGESARIRVESAFIRSEDVLGVQHLGVTQLFGHTEAVDEVLRYRSQRTATLVDALRHRFCPFGG